VSLTAREIAELVAELSPLAGARVGAVRVHAERALTLELHRRAGEALLLVSAEPDVTRLHAAARRPPQPAHPFPFQALLRRELEGARLAEIATRSGDRVVALRFERARGALQLVAELTGRHGNLFLVGDDGIIRASAGRNLSQRRKLVPGEPYQPPAPAAAAAAAGARHLSARPEPEPADTARPEPVEGLDPAKSAPFPLSAEVEARYAAREEQRLLLEGRRRLREPVRAGIARSARALERLAEEAARVPAAEDDRRRADLLKTSLRLVRRGAREVALTEWTAEGPREVSISIDPALSPQANMERYYRRYRRIADSAARVAARAGEVRAREEELRALLAVIEAATLAELPRLEKEARRLGAGPRPAAAPRGKRDEPLPPYRSFRSVAGVPLLVGRGAEQNDALTLRVARGNDLWLHVRGLSGAHVVVRLDRGKAPDQDSLLDAAHLAVHFSDARGVPQAEVAYTHVKHVRKVRGAAPGAVAYSQERVIALRVEPGRIERLLSEEAGEG
jgi:predicted ribosome quality control (RQC) complex YloA/Tae2 family protein